MSMDGSIEPVQEGDDRRGGGRHRIARLVVNFTLLAVAALTIGIAAYFPGYLKDIDKTLAGLLSNDKTSAAPIRWHSSAPCRDRPVQRTRQSSTGRRLRWMKSTRSAEYRDDRW
jgi:hypothetical protein